MRTRTSFAAVLVALALTSTAVADEACYTTTETDADTLVVTVPGGGFFMGSEVTDPTYVVNDVCQLDDPDPCLFSIWIYWETNGLPGLQRGDEVRDDMAGCPDWMHSDVIIS